MKAVILLLFVGIWTIIILIVTVIDRTHVLMYLPIIFAPISGLWWLCGWVREILHIESKLNYKQGFGTLAFVLFSFAIVGGGFAVAYLAAGKLGVPLCACKNIYQTDFLSCLYFSVVTASTLGYGDLSPHGLARLLACIEVVEFLTIIGAGGGLFARTLQS